MAAITKALGEEWVIEAIEYCLSGRVGDELARSVLRLLRPQEARDYCVHLFMTDPDLDRRRTAIDLLRAVAFRDTLPHVSTFLDDPDPTIQNWGAGVLDQLLWCQFVEPEECADTLELMRTHPNDEVVRTYEWITDFLAKRSSDR
ncbi:MAG: hypothetical protein JNM99_18030 [Verrucomicrobiaceae bacterium]|nr:hypothetical protein [Verrucomicrobiaceae bacterium]